MMMDDDDDSLDLGIDCAHRLIATTNSN